jgi:hypothetical protein
VNEGQRGEVDRVHVGLVERVAGAAAVGWALLVVAAIPAGLRAVGGATLGGAISVGSLLLHLGLVRRRARWRRRAADARLWAAWLAKWPVVAGVLYATLRGDLVSPLWLCLGIGLVPVAATALVVRAILADGRRLGTSVETR